MYKIYTYATHDTGYFNKLINNKFGAKVNVIGFGEKWKGFIHKLKRLLEEIKKEDPDTVIFIVDGFDTIMNKDPSIAYHIYKEKFDGKIVIALDQLNDNVFCRYFNKKIFLNKYPINAGMIVGKSKDLINLYIEVINYAKLKNETDDQRIFNIFKSNFVIDKYNEIFRNLNYEERKQILFNFKSVFVQTPGDLNVERFTRGIKEYSGFFIPEIILIIVLIIIGIYLYGKVS
jgi:hypothetical protein